MPSASPNKLTSGRSPFGVAEFIAFWWTDRRRRLQLWTWLCVAWLAFFSAQWFRVDKVVSGGARALGVTAETAYLPPSDVLRLVAIGQQSFAADLVYLRATQYFVHHLLTDSQLPWLDVYLDAIWDLDANCKSSYRWGSQVVKFGQTVDAQVSARANRFARLGLEATPDDPWLYEEIAYNLHYGMFPGNEDENKRLRALSLKYLQVAYSFPNFVYDPNYLSSQYARSGQVDEGIRSAMVAYASATDDQRRELRNMLKERDRAGDAAQLAWLDVVHQRDWWYLTPPLSVMIGPKHVLAPPLTPHDPMQWLREPATSEDLLKRLVVHEMLPPPTERPRDDENPAVLPAANTPAADPTQAGEQAAPEGRTTAH